MADRSAIEWTTATWNPTTGCDRISPGCDHCYALALAGRLKAMGQPKYQHDGDPRTSGPGFAVTIHPDALSIPGRWREPRLVFVDSMSDLFHARVPRAFVREVFEVMAGTPRHTFQVLTKRSRRLRHLAGELGWPPNVWMGVSVEAPEQLYRVGDLRSAPAAVRFLSCEPLLGALGEVDLAGIGWVIAGGESGRGHRPVEAGWVRQLRDECGRQSVPFFFKQWGGLTPKAGGRLLDGRTWDQMPAQTTVVTSPEVKRSAGRNGHPGDGSDPRRAGRVSQDHPAPAQGFERPDHVLWPEHGLVQGEVAELGDTHAITARSVNP